MKADTFLQLQIPSYEGSFINGNYAGPRAARINVVDQQSPVWREKDDLLRSVPGVGDQLWSDVAPFNKDSGPRRGKRNVWGGRSRLRAVLYMGAPSPVDATR